MDDPGAKRKEGIALHQRLISGDRTATAEIAEIYLPILTKRLSRKFPSLDDDHLIDSAVTDALLSYFKRPEQFLPEGMSLENYLFRSAWGDLLNALKTENRRRPLRLGEIVELEAGESEYIIEPASTENVEEEAIMNLSEIWSKLQFLLPDPTDQLVLSIMIAGERDTEVFSDVMGLDHLPADEKIRAVKRTKDRIKKVIQRNFTQAELKE